MTTALARTVPHCATVLLDDAGAVLAFPAATGIGTGISARDRARTMRVLADPGTRPDDLIRPGHVLPIRCADRGYAERARIWELACDLVAAAGYPPVAVVCRLVADGGDLLNGAGAESFASLHDLPMYEELA